MKSISRVKAALRSVGLLGAARLAYQLVDSDGRRKFGREWRALRQMHRQFYSGLKSTPRKPKHKVLVVGLTAPEEITLQAPLITAFRLAGYRPVIVLDSRSLLARAAYRAIGVDLFVYYEDYLPAAACAPDTAPDTSLESLLQISHQDAAIGRYAISWLMRTTRDGNPDLSAARRVAIQKTIESACAYAEAVRDIVDIHQPAAALLLDHGYSPAGQLFDIVLHSGGSCFSWNTAHRDGRLMLKRYGTDNRNVHPSSLSLTTWNRLKEMNWNDTWDRLRQEIEDCYHSGEWYGEVGTQFRKRFPSQEDLKVELGLDPTKKTAVIFPHIFWDATFFWGTDLFDNYEQWFIESLKAACANDRLNWIVKVHPGNLVKDRRDGYSGEHSEITAIRESVGTLPPHVHLIDASSDIGTLSLYHVLDYCVTVRGTVGVETSAFGKTVVTAGTGRYDRLGFTVDPDSRADYLATLARLETLPPPDSAQVELARRYAYGVFVSRPVHLQSVKFAFSQDAAASLDVSGSDGQTFWCAPDVTSIAEWIESGDDDYLNDVAQL